MPFKISYKSNYNWREMLSTDSRTSLIEKKIYTCIIGPIVLFYYRIKIFPNSPLQDPCLKTERFLYYSSNKRRLI